MEWFRGVKLETWKSVKRFRNNSGKKIQMLVAGGSMRRDRFNIHLEGGKSYT